MTSRAIADQLCLQCGICCNGILFSNVELQPAENPDTLAALRLQAIPVVRAPGRKSAAAAAGSLRIPQPCAALCPDNKCRIYDQRPRRCRDFECALFQGVAAGRLSVETALRKISQTLTQAQRVRRLLRQLGDADEHRPLAKRFQRLRLRLERASLAGETGDLFGKLSIAVHELNVILSQDFYPA